MRLELQYLKDKKSLLAFSYGVDSTALFYLLKSAGVEFDCAMVNYQTRPSSLDEELSAKNYVINSIKSYLFIEQI